MHWSGWVAVGLGFILGGWLTFDGTRAFVVGDYVTPRSGAYAGQLGPWSKLVAAVGLDPRSRLVKGVHVGLGVLWLAAIACFAARLPWAWWAVAGCAVASLWYAPIGTVIAVVELVLLSVWRGGGSPSSGEGVSNMWEIAGALGGLILIAGVFCVLAWLLKRSQANDRALSDKDSGKYNDAG